VAFVELTDAEKAGECKATLDGYKLTEDNALKLRYSK
jgi:hypothetical protein